VTSILRIGLIGCGIIGTRIAQAIDQGEVTAVLSAIHDQAADKNELLIQKLHTQSPSVLSLEEVFRKADMIVEAAEEALADAGIGPQDVQAAWAGTMFDYTGATISKPLKLQYIPITRVENACGTGIEALRAAAFAVAAGVYDRVLVVTYEKMKELGFPGLPNDVERLPRRHPVFEVGYTAAGNYALAATRYFRRYGLSNEEGKLTLAKISVKSHYNGARNPRAHLRREVTLEQVVNAPMIAWPLGLFDCCGVTDGAAAADLRDGQHQRNGHPFVGIQIDLGEIRNLLELFVLSGEVCPLTADVQAFHFDVVQAADHLGTLLRSVEKAIGRSTETSIRAGTVVLARASGG